jgi:hypothetical protein
VNSRNRITYDVSDSENWRLKPETWLLTNQKVALGVNSVFSSVSFSNFYHSSPKCSRYDPLQEMNMSSSRKFTDSKMLPVWGIRLDKLPYAWIWAVSLGPWHGVDDGRRKSCEGNITGPHPRSNNVRDFMINLIGQRGGWRQTHMTRKARGSHSASIIDRVCSEHRV